MRTADVGTILPELIRTISVVDMIAYAGATWDWHRLHYDQGYADQQGLPGPVVDGQALGALLAEHACAPFGPGARPIEMSFRFGAMLFAGVTVSVVGEITASEVLASQRHITVTQQVLGDGTVAIRDAITTVVVPQ